MEAKILGRDAVLRIDRGEEVFSKILEFARENDIKLASITGLGAVSDVVVAIYSVKDKKYRENNYRGEFEVTSFLGNISTMNDETYLHMHITFSDGEQKTYGGHMKSAIISATSEIFIHILDGKLDREVDELGLNILKF